MLSQLTVGWLLLLAAVLTFVAGFGLRTVIGHKRDVKAVRRVVDAVRDNAVGSRAKSAGDQRNWSERATCSAASRMGPRHTGPCPGSSTSVSSMPSADRLRAQLA
jgi:hypothetical protein